MKPKHVLEFAKGDRVPDWLLTAEPTSDQSTLGPVTFCVDGHVLEVNDRYFVFTAENAEKMIYVDVGKDVNFFAPTKTVRFVIGEMAVSGRESPEKDKGKTFKIG